VPRYRIVDYLVYLAVRIVICIVQALSIDTCVRGSSLLARLVCNVLGVRQGVIDENLRHAFPDMTATERRQVACGMWEHLFLLVVEVAHSARKVHDTNWAEYITFVGKRELVELLFDDRPLMIVSGHYGNFEFGAFALAVLGFPSYVIARPLDNPYLDRFVRRFRSSNGQRILPKVGSAPQIDSILERGGTLLFLADQYAGPKGCWVDFFGRPASTHKAIALFSLSNDAPLLYGFTRRLGKPLVHLLNCLETADPRAATGERSDIHGLTQWYTSRLEQTIREAPEQYWWVHRRWKDPRPKAPAETRAA